MTNATLEKFGYPGSLLREYDHWAVLLRPAQVTLGSLVLAAKSEQRSYADLCAEAFAEQRVAVIAIERALAAFARFERINYLMLMMVDPHVHFHVIPRYSEPREFGGMRFADSGWPGAPELNRAAETDSATLAAIRDELAVHFD